jgi:hypothetical protein
VYCPLAIHSPVEARTLSIDFPFLDVSLSLCFGGSFFHLLFGGCAMSPKKVFLQCLVGSLLFCAKVKASWVSWAGVGCTCAAVGVVVATSGGGAVWPAYALGMAEVALLVYDIGSSDLVDAGNPGFQNSSGGLTFNDSHIVKLRMLTVPDDDFADVTIATNRLIELTNSMIANLQCGANNQTQANDLLALADQIDVMYAELEELGMISPSLTGDEIRDIQADMSITGVPDWEMSALIEAGFGQTFRDKFVQRHLDADLTNIESLSVGQALINARNSLEERASELVLGGGGGGGGGLVIE